MRTAAILPLLLAAAPLVAAPRAVPPATPNGPAVDCLDLPIRESRVRDDRTIDFTSRTGQTYRNILPQSCPELGFEQAFSYETSLSKLCSVDIITVFRQGGGVPHRGASCGLGRFQPVTLPSRRGK